MPRHGRSAVRIPHSAAEIFPFSSLNSQSLQTPPKPRKDCKTGKSGKSRSPWNRARTYNHQNNMQKIANICGVIQLCTEVYGNCIYSKEFFSCRFQAKWLAYPHQIGEAGGLIHSVLCYKRVGDKWLEWTPRGRRRKEPRRTCSLNQIKPL